MSSAVSGSTMLAISRRPASTQRSPGIRPMISAAARLSALRSPQISTSSSSSWSRSESVEALIVCSAETTRTPSGAISAACCAAEPCGTPSTRVALPPTAAARGTVASTRSWPSLRTGARLPRFSAWLRKGTHRKTVSARFAASGFSTPSNVPPGTRCAALAAASAARSAAREPMTTGVPSRPSLTARPKPSAPVPPMIVTGSATAAQAIGSPAPCDSRDAPRS